jgi:hypothetical protein
MSAGSQLSITPSAAQIELADQQQPAILRGIQVTAELRDAGLELLQRQRRSL